MKKKHRVSGGRCVPFWKPLKNHKMVRAKAAQVSDVAEWEAQAVCGEAPFSRRRLPCCLRVCIFCTESSSCETRLWGLSTLRGGGTGRNSVFRWEEQFAEVVKTPRPGKGQLRGGSLVSAFPPHRAAPLMHIEILKHLLLYHMLTLKHTQLSHRNNYTWSDRARNKFTFSSA